MPLAVGLLLIGLNLRIGVASVGPVLTDIRADLGLSATSASLLTTIPVVAFGAFAFLTPPLTRRLGMHRLLGLTMLVLAAGFAVRLHPSLLGLFAGTVLVGAGIAVSNVVMPAAIKRDFSRHVGLMMGLYSMVLFIGAAAASGATAPLVAAVGGWRPALALWALPAVLALVCWIPQMRRRGPGREARGRDDLDTPSEYGEPSFRALVRDPVAWVVTAFMGLQSMAYYVFLTWVPTLLHDGGMDQSTAGWMVSCSTVPAIVASLASPAIIRRIRPAWLAVAASIVPFAIAYIGLALAPVEGGYAWMTLLGIGQGMAFSLAMSFIVWRSPDAHHTAHVSTLAQGAGYLVAGLGPLGIGALHSASHGWALPLAALGVLLVLQLVAGILASRDRYVLAGRASR